MAKTRVNVLYQWRLEQQILRILIGFLIPNLLWPASAEAGDTGWAIGVQHWQDANIEGHDGSPVSRNGYHASYGWQSRAYLLNASYVHHPVLIRADEPAHNGYFHQLDIRASRTFAKTWVQVAAGIHGTSNMFKYGHFHKEAAVLNFSVLQPVEALSADLGLNGDYRFGQFTLYPRFRREYDFAQESTLTVDLPIAVAWQSANKKWNIGVEKYGNKWATLDKQREVEAAFYLQEWRLRGRRQIRSDIYVELGLSVDTEVVYQDLYAGRVEQDLDRSVYIAVGWKSF